MKKITLAALAAVLLAGCAAVQQRPVLYPNARLKQVGEAAAQRDVDECVAMAERAGASSGGSSAARGGVQGAAVGGAAAAVGSLIRGRNVLSDAAAGAAVGGTAGAVGGAFHDGEGSPVFRNFVGRCLAERGYDVIGWK
ncbi:MAG: lipoprotein [Proteobacteria bacterium]|nr:lipoprotein [Pseudomonadota bacterium]